MKLFDLHCDTPLELFLKKEKLYKNSLHISLEKAEEFEKYIQCAAIWSDPKLTEDQCFQRFFEAAEFFKGELSRCGVTLIKTKRDLNDSTRRGAILAVEGARLLRGEPDGIASLYNEGVRILTLVWKGSDWAGGAWDTNGPLSPQGAECVEMCFDTGIIPDVSHGSPELISRVLDIAEKRGASPLATHSNSFSVNPHRRNLSDDLFRRICHMGGLCGINLCPDHLCGGNASRDDILRHIEHYINLGGEENIALGCDYDGISEVPDGIEDISHLPRLYDAAVKRFGAKSADRLFFENANKYMLNNLPD